MKMMIPGAMAALLAAAAPAVAADVTVRLDGVRAGKGALYVGLQTRDEFLRNQGRHGARIERPEPGSHTVTLRDVPAGDYSISVWHDTDGDGRFSMAENGMPKDGWAMLNGETLRAEPKWEQVSFTVPAAGASEALTMIYPDE